MLGDNEQETRVAESGEQRRAAAFGVFAQTLQMHVWQSHKMNTLAAERMEITWPQLVSMLVLEAQEGNCTMQELAALTYQSGATVTGIVDRLLNTGMVTRKHDEKDRRVVVVSLTDAGRAQLARTKAQSDKDIMQVTESFSDDELEEFTRLIQKFTDSFKSLVGHDSPPFRR
ncbi:MarR family winged helix-turn-helix transcriptional regulator [Tengunoibacter tsumagoiensis]|uniref:MarR family transcriptional regulator n=1 Tax=Tengunoibacter tsumagoiensis TaxID=2014871 RepID=A0A402A7J6_9CHLR|nr:MarR family transcriptional regulator [Tengunoibacter tsumagoiensis]GCE15127.1 MarR family transcriptional regulator [Tengunoibacter tsumagoiensis]